MLLGCIGDDFTGSSDLANTLAKGGMRTVQFNGIPAASAPCGVEAGVVALKTRTVAAGEAVRLSLGALAWLREQGCRQFLFKYCSTFDSTPDGNIGPVLDALTDALGTDRAIVCPAFPATGRSIYQGHLFVADRLLSASGMRDHPLTPMTDPDLRRWLALQTHAGIGHVAYPAVAEGTVSIRRELDRETAAGRRYIVVDALRDEDLVAIGEAAADDLLLSGGSGIALGLPSNFKRKGLIEKAGGTWTGSKGPVAALCGSCSETSRDQIARHRETAPVREAEAEAIVSGKANADEFADWVLSHQAGGVPLVYSSADPAKVAAAQARNGAAEVASAVERFHATLARTLRDRGLKRLVTAGGETSGAIVSELAISAFEIGPEIDPGVPALRAGEDGMALALKSGNFGSRDFFAKAARMLEGEAR